ncbi:MAG: hypothetical protein AAGF07_05585 [Patescibacteria group bacterium]
MSSKSAFIKQKSSLLSFLPYSLRIVIFLSIAFTSLQFFTSVNVFAETAEIRFVDNITGDYRFVNSLMVCLNDELSGVANNQLDDGIAELIVAPGSNSVKVLLNMGAFDPVTVCTENYSSPPNNEMLIYSEDINVVSGETYTITMSGEVLNSDIPEYTFTNIDSVAVNSSELVVFNQSATGSSPLPSQICIGDTLVNAVRTQDNYTVSDYPTVGSNTLGFLEIYDVSNAVSVANPIQVSYPYFYLGNANCSLVNFYPSYPTEIGIVISTGSNPVAQNVYVGERDANAEIFPPASQFSGYSFSSTSELPLPSDSADNEYTQPVEAETPTSMPLIRSGGATLNIAIGMILTGSLLLMLRSVSYNREDRR